MCEANDANLHTEKINAVCLASEYGKNQIQLLLSRKQTSPGQIRNLFYDKRCLEVLQCNYWSILTEMSHNLIFLIGLQKGHLVVHSPKRLDLEVFGQGNL